VAELNPYARFLGARDPLTVLRATPAELRRHLDGLEEAALRRKPRPNAWSAAEVLIHLAEVEVVHYTRLRFALAEDHHRIHPFDQNAWAERYDAFSWREALALFVALRVVLLRLAERLGGPELARPVTHPERGTMTVRVLLETFAGHDLSHLAQLERIRST
jgi:hypothetical protein